MSALPPFVLRVTVPMIAPIVASVGNLVVVQASHPAVTVAVTDATGRRVLRSRYVEPEHLYETILSLTTSGVLVFLRIRDARSLELLRPRARRRRAGAPRAKASPGAITARLVSHLSR